MYLKGVRGEERALSVRERASLSTLRQMLQGEGTEMSN